MNQQVMSQQHMTTSTSGGTKVVTQTYQVQQEHQQQSYQQFSQPVRMQQQYQIQQHHTTQQSGYGQPDQTQKKFHDSVRSEETLTGGPFPQGNPARNPQPMSQFQQPFHQHNQQHPAQTDYSSPHGEGQGIPQQYSSQPIESKEDQENQFGKRPVLLNKKVIKKLHQWPPQQSSQDEPKSHFQHGTQNRPQGYISQEPPNASSFNMKTNAIGTPKSGFPQAGQMNKSNPSATEHPIDSPIVSTTNPDRIHLQDVGPLTLPRGTFQDQKTFFENQHSYDPNKLEKLKPQEDGIKPEWPPKNAGGPNMTMTYPSAFKLRDEAPIDHQTLPLSAPSQPAFKLTTPIRKRGDEVWPPRGASQDEPETTVREFARPTKANKNYDNFFAKNFVPNNYPGYKAPPGTQHVGYMEEAQPL